MFARERTPRWISVKRPHQRIMNRAADPAHMTEGTPSQVTRCSESPQARPTHVRALPAWPKVDYEMRTTLHPYFPARSIGESMRSSKGQDASTRNSVPGAIASAHASQLVRPLVGRPPHPRARHRSRPSATSEGTRSATSARRRTAWNALATPARGGETAPARVHGLGRARTCRVTSFRRH